jgi:hypothetical protein|tara:strand:- start:3754 stop:4632 length:879 start_codon:yes stop_codon:yes gene_type:complete
MIIKKQMNRREIIGGMGAIAASPFVSGQEFNVIDRDINLSDPIQNALAYAKLIGTSARSMVHIYYHGTIFGMTPDEGVKPMIGLTGVLKGVWKPWVDNGFYYTLYDCGYFMDLKTGAPIEEFENPFTGEINRPVKIIGGPFDRVIKPDLRPFKTRGDDLWLEEPAYLNFVNKLDPKIWKKASTGEKLSFLYVETYHGKVSDLANPELDSIPMTITSTHNTSWYPFFLMGQRPGGHYWQSVGKKVENLEVDVPSVLIDYIENESPGYFESERPWKKRTGTFQAYKNQRKPIED